MVYPIKGPVTDVPCSEDQLVELATHQKTVSKIHTWKIEFGKIEPKFVA